MIARPRPRVPVSCLDNIILWPVPVCDSVHKQKLCGPLGFGSELRSLPLTVLTVVDWRSDGRHYLLYILLDYAYR